MSGKQKCKMLKEIRKKIADANDIPYVIEECPHKGECKGTCPRCESEVRYLEDQLSARASLGKRVALTALCAGMVLTSVGCEPSDMMNNRELEGDMAYIETKSTTKTTTYGRELGGEPLPPEEDWGLMGDVGPIDDEYYEEDYEETTAEDNTEEEPEVNGEENGEESNE